MFKQRVLRNLDKRLIFYYVIHPVRYELQIRLWNLLPFLPHFIIFNYVPFCYCDLKTERFYFFQSPRLVIFQLKTKAGLSDLKQSAFLITPCTWKSHFVFSLLLFFQSNFFAHPQGLTDAEMTESAYSLRKHAMGLMTVGTTLMKITAMVNLSSWNYWFISKLQDKRMNLLLKIIAKNSLCWYEGLFPGSAVETAILK